MERSANMHAYDFFVECIKNNNPKKLVNMLAERQAARTKVSNVVVTAKAAAKATEATLWNAAAKNVLKASEDSR